MSEYDDPRPSSQPEGSTDLAVAKDNLITLDKVLTAESGSEITNRIGKHLTPVIDVVDGAESVVQKAIDQISSVVSVPDGNVSLTQTGAELQEVLDDSASVLKAVAVSLNTEVENVILSTNTTDAIPAYIYNEGNQLSYLVPSDAQGKFIDSVAGSLLTTTDASTYSLPTTTRINEIVEVGSYGASATGDSSDAFQSAVDALSDEGGVISLGYESIDYTIATIPTYGDKVVKFIGVATINGVKAWGNNLGVNQDTFSPALNREIKSISDDTAENTYNVDWSRYANYSGGATGNPNTLHRLYTYVAATVGGDPTDGTGNGRKAEWTQQARIDNYSDWANAVAVTGQARAYAQGAAWSGQFNTIDYVVPTTYARRSIEANIQAEGADVNGLRFIVEAVAHSIDLTYNSGDDSIYAGFKASMGSADLKHAFVVEEEGGQGKITDSAFYASFSGGARLIDAENTDSKVQEYRTAHLLTGDLVTQHVFGLNSESIITEFARDKHTIAVNTSGAEKGQRTFQVMKGGVMTTVMSVSGDSSSLLLMVGNSLKRVTEGAEDSGDEAGYRMLRVPN